ncbi:MAG TPA: hypothetical protein VIW46_00060, partial [Acidimicrobiia bacterium]
LDLVLFGPPVETYLRGEPQLGFGLVEDFVYGLTPDERVDPNTLEDIPLTPPAGSVLHAVSATRGGTETIDTGALRPGTYTIQVSGYNGTTDNDAYALRLRTSPLPDIVGCPSTNLWGSALASYPGGPTSGINTVFLYNAATYPGSAADLVALTQHSDWDGLGIQATAIAIDSDLDVRAALHAWESIDPQTQESRYCDPTAANDVVAEIGTKILDPILDDPLNDLQYVVIVGGDEHVPFARSTDGTFVANETAHGLSLDTLDAIKAALGEGYYLTDTPYGGQSYKVADRELFIPVQAVGRLVFDTAANLKSRFESFLASDGVLGGAVGETPAVANGFAVVAGYDFLLDGAIAAQAALLGEFSTVNELLGETWNKADLSAAVNGTAISRPSLAVIEAHFDEKNLAPANADPGGSQIPPSDALLTVDEYLALENRAFLMLTPGCHSALALNNGEPGDPSWLDWTDVTDIVGNLGYGYGDTEIVALSERVVELTAERIGSQPVGIAVRNAMNEYAQDLYVITPYDMKVMEQFTVFGFPMARVPGVPTETTSVAFSATSTATGAEPEVFNDAFTGLPSSTKTIDFSGLSGLTTPSLWTRTQAPVGTEDDFYDLLTVRGHAVLPDVTVDVSSTGREAAGVLVTGLTSAPKISGFDPLVFEPQAGEQWAGTSTDEYRPQPGDYSFPATIQSSVRHVLGDDGNWHDRVVIVPARHYTEDGGSSLEIFTSVELQTLYRPDGWNENSEPAVPFIERTIGRSRDGSVEFEITVQPPAGGSTERVLVLFRKEGASGAWAALELASPDGTQWIGRAATGVGTQEFFVQAVGQFGDIAQASDKVLNYDSTDSPLVQQLTVAVSDAGNPVFDYWYPARDGDDVVATASIPQGSLCSYTIKQLGPLGAVVEIGNLIESSSSIGISSSSIGIEGDGEYLLTVFGSSSGPEGCSNPDDVGVLALAIDGTGPETTITVTTQPDASAEVVIVAVDAGSGVKLVEYSLDGGVTWTGYTGPFPVTWTTTILYRAVDYLDNSLGVQELLVQARDFGFCYLYDPDKTTSGAVAVKIRITTNTWDVQCDGTENNISGGGPNDPRPYAWSVDGDPAPPQDSGKANQDPTYQFRYDRKLGGYIYNLNMPLADGPHYLEFTVNEDPVTLRAAGKDPVVTYLARFVYRN